MPEEIETADGATLEVADHPSEAGVVVTGATVSGSKKENLGNYENYEPHASVRVEFRPALRMDRVDGEDALYAKLRGARGVVDDHLEDAIANVVDGREYE